MLVCLVCRDGGEGPAEMEAQANAAYGRKSEIGSYTQVHGSNRGGEIIRDAWLRSAVGL